MEETTLSSEDGRPSTERQKVASKVHKAAQPGEKAPEDVVKLWKENGFTRLTLIFFVGFLN